MPLPVKTKKIDRLSMRETVYHNLLDWIVEGVLRPGEKIVDKELADHMGVSRTPVREALRRLEDKNLIESSANRWTRISNIPDDQPAMVYPLIWTLETLALSSAILRINKGDILAMNAANKRLDKALENEDPVEASRADNQFHAVFIRQSKNIHLMTILQDLKISSRRLEILFFNRPLSDTSSVSEHGVLIKALTDRNLPLAEKTVHLNWKKSLDRLTLGRNISS